MPLVLFQSSSYKEDKWLLLFKELDQDLLLRLYLCGGNIFYSYSDNEELAYDDLMTQSIHHWEYGPNDFHESVLKQHCSAKHGEGTAYPQCKATGKVPNVTEELNSML